MKRILLQLRIMLADSRSDVGHFGDLDQRRNGTGLILINQMEKWDQLAENMMTNFSESSHPIFRASSAFERGELISKGHGKKSIHFNGSEENIELLLRTIISANQLSVYGAVAGICKCPKIQRLRWNLQRIRFGIIGNTYRTSYCWSSHQRGVAGKPAARL